MGQAPKFGHRHSWEPIQYTLIPKQFSQGWQEGVAESRGLRALGLGFGCNISGVQAAVYFDQRLA